MWFRDYRCRIRNFECSLIRTLYGVYARSYRVKELFIHPYVILFPFSENNYNYACICRDHTKCVKAATNAWRQQMNSQSEFL